MRARVLCSAIVLAAMAASAAGQGGTRINPLIELLEQKKPVFGLYAPRPGGGRGAAGDTAVRPAIDLAKETLAYRASDFVFSGSMEGGVDRGLPAFKEFVDAMATAGALTKTPSPRLTHPLVVKTPAIAPDPAKAIANISRQLNLGVSGIVFVEAESAEEVRQGLAAMRFKSKGGTRPDDVGSAPAYWGMTEQEYKDRADLWPLNPKGELVNWTIVEGKEGLAHVREIAAVKGISVLFPGAGTLRGVFTTTNAAGERVFDRDAHEKAIQQVLAACKEFNVPCGYPATADDIEQRMKQGFSVFIMNWGEAGFKAVDIGRAAAGRPSGS
jgi:4-hydroxy-2-oxoheptanedioate aldolase